MTNFPDELTPISGESLFYNRDKNLSDVSLVSLHSSTDLIPSYGSQVSFTANNHSYQTDNSFYNLIPLSANSLTAKFDMKYDVNESDAKSLVNFFESHSGVKQFQLQTDQNIYGNVSGVCAQYAVNHINKDHYEVAAAIDVLEAPTLFNWSGMNFVTGASTLFKTGVSYEKYDVVFTGDHSSNKFNCFFYSTEDHSVSSAHTSPTGSDSKWSQKFYFEPDAGLQNTVDLKVNEINFKNSHKLRLKLQDNVATVPLNYKFTSITTKQLKGMLHFLENKGGYRRFEHQIPSLYNRPKVYYCPQWSHTFKYHNTHDLDVTLIEDPMGVIPTGS